MSTYHDKENRDDLHSAIESNGGAIAGKFEESEIEKILAEVCGEGDGYDWWWVIQLTGSRFVLLHGGCDYTGWDCQSWLHVDHINNTSALTAAERAPESDSNRQIRSNLVAQLKGEKPFALYSDN